MFVVILDTKKLQNILQVLYQLSQFDNKNTETVIYSSTPAPSGQPNDEETNNKGIMIGVTVGVSLIFVILIIIIIILVTLFVWRSHHCTDKMTVNTQNNGQQMFAITNPVRNTSLTLV